LRSELVDGEDAVTMTVHHVETPNDEGIAQLDECGILLFAAMHRPWVREYGGVLFVNCGSVGGLPRCIAYDAQAGATEIRIVDLPRERADQLSERKVRRIAERAAEQPDFEHHVVARRRLRGFWSVRMVQSSCANTNAAKSTSRESSTSRSRVDRPRLNVLVQGSTSAT
jgi:hypothetical protein